MPRVFRRQRQLQQNLQPQLPLLLQIPLCLYAALGLMNVVDFIVTQLQVLLSNITRGISTVFGVLINGELSLPVMFQDVLTDINYFLSYYISKTTVGEVVQNLTNQAHIKFSVVYNYTLRFLEICQEVFNIATYIGGWFYGSILRLGELLDVYFPGGFLGITIMMFFIIVIHLALVLQQVQKLSKAYSRCMEDQKQLQLQLEDSKFKLQEETQKLKQESDSNEKLKLSLEEERESNEKMSSEEERDRSEKLKLSLKEERIRNEKQKLSLREEEERNEKLKLSLKEDRSRKEKLKLSLKEERLRNDKLKLSLKKEMDKNEEMKLNLEKETDKILCLICQDKVKTILLLPCQHMCLCKQCLDREEWNKCPICRQGVESKMEIYL